MIDNDSDEAYTCRIDKGHSVVTREDMLGAGPGFF